MGGGGGRSVKMDGEMQEVVLMEDIAMVVDRSNLVGNMFLNH